MSRGFTIIEIVIVISILLVLVLAAVPFFQSFSVSHQMETSTQDILNTLRRAQSAAMGSKENSKFGVYLGTGSGASYTFFQGDTYAGRDTEYDEVYTLPPTISLSLNIGGGSEIIFGKLKGVPNVTGTITLTSVDNETRILNINQVGRIDIQ
jgi:prepilin-type N-terminal cleavage/methylation domain-containing protein